MKRLLLFIFLLAGASSFAQLRKIPAAVTDAFKEKYPHASKVEWKDKVSVFTATFEENDVQYQARFNSKGEWVSTEKELEEAELPSTVKDGLDKSKYAEWPVEKTYKIELPDDVIQYRVSVAKSDIQKKNLLFNSEGRLLKDKITL